MSNVALPPRRFGWFADRPIGVKIGAVIALLAVGGLGTQLLGRTPLTENSGGPVVN